MELGVGVGGGGLEREGSVSTDIIRLFLTSIDGVPLCSVGDAAGELVVVGHVTRFAAGV